MNTKSTHDLQLKDGRPCHDLPWVSGTPQPWGSQYRRVMIEMSPTERIRARRTHHIQVVHKSKVLAAR